MTDTTATPAPVAVPAAPSPELQAAAPVIIQALGYLKQAVTTILTGDPILLPGRIAPAIAIMDNQLLLLLPALANAEEPVLLSQATSGIDGLIGKLQGLSPKPAA